MAKSVYNLDKIVKIEVQEKRESRGFYYSPAKSYLLGLLKDKEGFRFNISIDHKIYTKEEVEADTSYGHKLIVEGDKVYCKPRVVVHFVGDFQLRIVCDTNEEAYKQMQDIKTMAIPMSLESND